jgi:hypothetical protein
MRLVLNIAGLLNGERRRQRRELKATFERGFEQARRAAMLNVYKPGSKADLSSVKAGL